MASCVEHVCTKIIQLFKLHFTMSGILFETQCSYCTVMQITE